MLQSAILLQSTGLARKGEKRYSEVERFKKGGMGDATKIEFLPLKNPTDEQKQ
ncbi:hypothetical protein FACS189463_2400 [Bacteroidia bacterium]|nr:hypothetical protein AGMMS49574_15390 [Bacteroidia bacterium]GHT76748.1 hypothetical protein FACS189463_2400 [Bacteroidia bacterium]